MDKLQLQPPTSCKRTPGTRAGGQVGLEKSPCLLQLTRGPNETPLATVRERRKKETRYTAHRIRISEVELLDADKQLHISRKVQIQGKKRGGWVGSPQEMIPEKNGVTVKKWLNGKQGLDERKELQLDVGKRP